MRDAEVDRPRGARGAVGGAGARFDPCGFGRINCSVVFCAIHSGRHQRRHGFAVDRADDGTERRVLFSGLGSISC